METFSNFENQTAFIVSTGSELVNGNQVDSNAPYLANKLINLGWSIKGISILPDNPKIIHDTLTILLNDPKLQMILITGGLGPTEDDHTIDILSKLFNLKTVTNKYAKQKVNLLIKKRKLEDMREILMRQTRILESSNALENSSGLAPGLLLNAIDHKKFLVALPGVPSEMKLMVEQNLLPQISKLTTNNKIYHNKYFLYDISESFLQTKLFNHKGLNKNELPEDFKWGVTSSYGFLNLYTESQNQHQLQKIDQKIKALFKNYIFEISIIDIIHNYCIDNNIKVSIAESCSGGLISKIITDIPGSSKWFLGSVVSYSNKSKINILNVNEKTINEKGAVSENCAIEMLDNVSKIFHSDYSIITTGIAGPTGGSTFKPVGTVYIGITGKNSSSRIIKKVFPTGRERIRSYSAWLSLYYLYCYILENN